MGWPVGNVRQLKLGDALILTDGPLGLFIIDGIITIPIALLGFIIMPGAFGLTEFVMSLNLV